MTKRELSFVQFKTAGIRRPATTSPTVAVDAGRQAPSGAALTHAKACKSVWLAVGKSKRRFVFVFFIPPHAFLIVCRLLPGNKKKKKHEIAVMGNFSTFLFGRTEI